MERDYNKLILDKLDVYTEVYFKALNQCSISFSEKHIHDLRVGIRRMMSLMKFTNSFVPNVYTTNLLKHLKSKMKLLSPLRDVQVQLLRINAFESLYPDLQFLFFYLFRKERNIIEGIQYKIIERNKLEIEANLLWMKLRLTEIFRTHVINDNNFLEQYLILKENLITTMNAIDKDKDESIHQLRLAFKKYRYNIEIICSLFPENKDEIKKLRKLQNTMGAIQDIFVISNTINSFIKNGEYQNSKDYLNFSNDLTVDKQFLKTKLYKQIENYIYPSIEKSVRRTVFP